MMGLIKSKGWEQDGHHQPPFGMVAQPQGLGHAFDQGVGVDGARGQTGQQGIQPHGGRFSWDILSTIHALNFA